MVSESYFTNGIHVLSYLNEPKKDKWLLFIHGAWHGAWCYEKNFLPYFNSKGFDCYALDLRSHGKSESKGHFRFISLNNYVQDVHTVVQELKKDRKVILIAHSMGGIVVQKYLTKYTDEIESAVLLAPASTWGVRSFTFKGVLLHHPLIYLKMNITLSMYPLVKSFKLYKEIFYYSESDEKLLHEYHSQTQNESFRAIFSMLYTPVKYKKITTPVLIVGGDHDQIFKMKHLEKLSSKLPKGEVTFFENTGHNLMVEKDWQKVANTIINWIQKR